MIWVANGLDISPATAPSLNPHDQQDGLLFMRDRRYALHGKVMAFTVIAIFTLALVSLVFALHLRRRRPLGAESEPSDPVRWWNERRTNPLETPSGLKDEWERRY